MMRILHVNICFAVGLVGDVHDEAWKPFVEVNGGI